MTAKQLSRVRLMQAFYRWQLGGEDPQEIEKEYLSKTKKQDNFSKSYFQSIFMPVIETHKEINAELTPFLDRDVKHLGHIERSILWLSIYELKHKIEVPKNVVINEGIELAKEYGADQSYKYINRILDDFKKALA
jgi:N utilization substance protein B